MKKTILTVAMMLGVLIAKSQTKTNTIFKTKFGNLTEVSYKEFVQLDKGDTTRYVYLGFRNEEYSYINDWAGVYLWYPDKDTNAIKDFVTDLQLAIDNLGQTMWNQKKNYRISISEQLPRLIFLGCGKGDTKSDAYTTITKKNAQELIIWLQTTKF